jgi:hypothetical protein
MDTQPPSVGQPTTTPRRADEPLPTTTTPRVVDPLRSKVEQLAEARSRAAHARLLVDEERARWADQHRDLLAEEQEAARLAAALEAEVREEACRVYGATGSKQPAQGVSIAITKKVSYEAERVLRWALAKGLCLTLDTKAFEALARKNVPRDDEGAPLAVVEEVPQARISSSLTAPGAPSGPAGSWQVPSDSRPGVVYTVARGEDGTLTCTCPAGQSGRPCKHLRRIPGSGA